jgi:hypothetical protein
MKLVDSSTHPKATSSRLQKTSVQWLLAQIPHNSLLLPVQFLVSRFSLAPARLKPSCLSSSLPSSLGHWRLRFPPSYVRKPKHRLPLLVGTSRNARDLRHVPTNPLPADATTIMLEHQRFQRYGDNPPPHPDSGTTTEPATPERP